MLVFRLGDLEFQVILGSGNVDSSLEGHRGFEYGEVIVVGHIKLVLPSNGHLVAVNSYYRRKHLDGPVFDSADLKLINGS